MVAKLSTTSKIVLLSGSLLFPALHLCSQETEAIVIRDVRHGVSAPLRSIKDTPTVVELEMDRGEAEEKVSKNEAQASHIPSYDPALQTGILASRLTQIRRIQGLGSSGRLVPDTNGAAGATQYMQWVNSEFAVYLKATGKLVLTGKGNKFWSGLTGPCENTTPNDGVILYDKLASRWVVSHYAGFGPYVQCVAVSTTTDATGSYNQYAFTLPTSYFTDYGKIGSWPDAYYLSINLLNQNDNFDSEGGLVCALNRANMLAGKSATAQCFTTTVQHMSLLPADLDGTTAPPAGSPNYLLDLGANALELWKFHVDWVTPSNSKLTGPTTIAVAKYSEACGGGVCIPQPPPGTLLDSLGDRLMHRLVYRNFGTHESIVATHSVNPPTNSSSAIRWYEIRSPGGTPTVYQQGTFSPDQQSRWMPSIAMDKNNDIAVGYSVSSNVSSNPVNPSIRYAGRLSTDALGTLETETNVVIGDGVQTVTDRWGDYSGMSVDPTDDCTFWYTNQYLPATGNSNWSTFIVSFKFPSCP